MAKKTIKISSDENSLPNKTPAGKGNTITENTDWDTIVASGYYLVANGGG